MTNSTMALAELAEKRADVDVLRQTVQLHGPAPDGARCRCPAGAGAASLRAPNG